jgi:tetratricopeptide (TPR) repeat protein
MQFKWNSIKIEGDNNLVIQDSEGNIESFAIQEFIAQFTKEKDEQITLLNKLLYDKEKIEQLSDSEIRHLSQELEKVQEEKLVLEDRISQMLEEFDGKDISQAGEIYQEAFNLFIQGKLDEVLAILPEARLQEELLKIEQKEEATHQARKKLADTYILKAQMLQLKFDFEAAAVNYEKAIEVFEDWETHFEAANFYKFLNQFDLALGHYEAALKLANKGSQKAKTLNDLGALHSVMTNYTESRSCCDKALQIYRQLAEVNPQTFLPNVAATLNNLGVGHKQTTNYTESRSCFDEALKIYHQLAEMNQQAFLPDVAMTLNNLATLHSDTTNYTESRSCYDESLQIYRQLAEVNPQAFLPYVATTLNNLATLHSATTNYTESRSCYDESLQIYRQLAEVNPQAFGLGLSMTLINIGIFYLQVQSNQDLSLAHTKEAILTLLPFLENEIPAAQQYMQVAIQILQAWGIDSEQKVRAFLEEG